MASLDLAPGDSSRRDRSQTGSQKGRRKGRGALSEGVDGLETLPGASGSERRGQARVSGAGGPPELGVAVVACHAVGRVVPYVSQERVPSLNVMGRRQLWGN